MTAFSKDYQPKDPARRGKAERTKIIDAMKAAGKTEEEFYALLIKRAFDVDDTFGAPELLKRLYPVPKSTMPFVIFDFDKDATPSVQATQVILAASNGFIAPDVANIFINSIASMLKIDEVTELQDRLASIEESLGVGNA